MRKIILSAALLLATSIQAQEIQTEGIDYFLPKTAVRIALKIEKKTYTPGEYAEYAENYLKRSDVSLEPEVKYELLNIHLLSVGMPDSTKMFTIKMDGKRNINHVDLNEKGILLAINMTGEDETAPKTFVPSPKPQQLNPRDFMNAEILASGSKAKMAELVAQDIMEIRESRNQLTRGQADFMPKDGEQLKVMLEKLDTQEKALSQLFLGTEDADTTEVILNFIPTKEVDKQLLFRFSDKLGMTDIDDLGGRPYYISVKDEHSVPSIHASFGENREKDASGVCVNLPGRISIGIHSKDQQIATFGLFAAQFGKLVHLPIYIFTKKTMTKMRLNPTTGYPETFNVENLR